MFNKKYLLCVTTLLVIGLQACGGGSGSDNTNTATATNINTTENTETVPIVPENTLPTPEVPSAQVTIETVFGPVDFIKITDGEAGLNANIESGDRFGRDHDNAGDINGDGITDLIVGARSDDDGATDAGAVYILFMNNNGTVNSHQKISMLEGNFTDTLVEHSFFGYGVAGIGDYNGDNIPDVAVSAPSGDIPAIYILHLNTNGTVKSMVKHTSIIAQGLSAIGDINQDGRIDLVAADPSGNDGGSIHILFYNEHSELIQSDTVTIGENMGGFGNGLNPDDDFGGRESVILGDLDGDGSQELAVGAFMSDGGLGAIWILSLDNDTHHVIDKFKIAPSMAGFNEIISTELNVNGTSGGQFGHAIVATGDLNGDGVPDLITGANQYNNGVGYVIYLNSDKTVKTFTRIDDNEGGFDLQLETNERFSRSMSIIDNDTNDDIITVNIGGGAGDFGAIYALTFQQCTFTDQGQNTFWEDGTTLFTNWDHNTQMVTTALTYEQCTLKSFENNVLNMTTNTLDGRCIIKDASAVLSISDEGSQAYIRSCP